MIRLLPEEGGEKREEMISSKLPAKGEKKWPATSQKNRGTSYSSHLRGKGRLYFPQGFPSRG